MHWRCPSTMTSTFYWTFSSLRFVRLSCSFASARPLARTPASTSDRSFPATSSCLKLAASSNAGLGFAPLSVAAADLRSEQGRRARVLYDKWLMHVSERLKWTRKMFGSNTKGRHIIETIGPWIGNANNGRLICVALSGAQKALSKRIPNVLRVLTPDSVQPCRVWLDWREIHVNYSG